MQSIIRTQLINKSYYKSYGAKLEKKSAVEDLSINVKRGSILGILGPNGAGKSTLVNILSGLLKYDSGSIFVNGLDYDIHKDEVKKTIGVVPQEISIDPFFSVIDTIKIFAGYYGVKKSDSEIIKILCALGLEDKIHSMPRSLSGGMKRRLLIAKALVHDPEIIILDEPTAGVDISLREKIFKYILELNKKGKTIILTTHYMEEAEKLCDDIAIINKGKLVAFDNKDKMVKVFPKKEIEVYPSNKTANNVIIHEADVVIKKSNTGNSLILQYDSFRHSFSDIIEILNQSGIKINDVKIKEPSLQMVFESVILNNL
jgi:ABC-2 type transport system ATP-binding protein